MRKNVSRFELHPADFSEQWRATPELYAPAEALPALKAEAGDLISWDLTDRQLCDLELLLNGGFAPLTGFLDEADYDRVLDEMRLASGALWPIPVTLDVNADFAASLAPGQRIAILPMHQFAQSNVVCPPLI